MIHSDGWATFLMRKSRRELLIQLSATAGNKTSSCQLLKDHRVIFFIKSQVEVRDLVDKKVEHGGERNESKIYFWATIKGLVVAQIFQHERVLFLI